MHTSINIIEILQIDILWGMEYKKLYTNMLHKTGSSSHLKCLIHREELQYNINSI